MSRSHWGIYIDCNTCPSFIVADVWSSLSLPVTVFDVIFSYRTNYCSNCHCIVLIIAVLQPQPTLFDTPGEVTNVTIQKGWDRYFFEVFVLFGNGGKDETGCNCIFYWCFYEQDDSHSQNHFEFLWKIRNTSVEAE